jgi:hypothetical protein
MITTLIFVIFVGSPASYVDEKETESYYLARATHCFDEIATFFGNKDQTALENLMLSDHPRVSVFAAWILCQRRCLETDNPEQRLRLRHEFLGFLTGRLKLRPPTWWRDFILNFAATDTYHIVDKIYSFALEKGPGRYPNGIHYKNNFICAKSIDPISVTSRSLHIKDNGNDVKVEMKTGVGMNWEYEDYFIMKGDTPNAIATQTISEKRRIIAVSGTLLDLNLFCVTENGTKLWSTPIRYHVDSCLQGLSGMEPEYQLIEIQATSKEVAIFWVCYDAISFTLLDTNTGAEIVCFSTKFRLKKLSK